MARPCNQCGIKNIPDHNWLKHIKGKKHQKKTDPVTLAQQFADVEAMLYNEDVQEATLTTPLQHCAVVVH